MIDISLNNIEKYYGANQVLENVSFEIHSNDRIGIVGKNGCGKSTLFKIITEEEPYDKGSFSKRKGIKIGYLLVISIIVFLFLLKNCFLVASKSLLIWFKQTEGTSFRNSNSLDKSFIDL